MPDSIAPFAKVLRSLSSRKRPQRSSCAVWAFGITLFLGFCAWSSCARAAELDFNRDIRGILSNKCFLCHGPDEGERQANLRLDQREGAVASGPDGRAPAVVPGKPEESELILRLIATDPDVVMPPPSSGKQLTPAEVELLRQWVREGAKYSQHWSYIPPERPPVPDVQNSAWVRNEIDRFVLARLEQQGLSPQPEADRETLVRRLSLDLTGLPPTIAEVDDFLADASTGAIGTLVDRLLKKEAYGEHWARLWLDLARYADSAGYADDPPRTIWAYRDYVIRAFNRNLPYDQFTLEQLAGDLLPGRTDEQLIATAFHRNTLTNNEGGTNDEEFRNVAVVDRVNTTMAVWMGTTMACAQCHSHKYDPLTQSEYFQLFDFFNQSADADRYDESPYFEIWNEEERRQKRQYEEELANWNQQQSDPPSAAVEAAAARLRKLLKGYRPITTVPVMSELPPEQQRATRIHLRGNFQSLGDAVQRGVPGVFHPLNTSGSTPGEVAASVNRLALAQWLVDRRNPLTARVMVNRLWEQLFGIGLVATSEEFGSQGELPSHPELLDWLAVEFMDSGWDIQHMLRLMVTSATYRQSSRMTPELAALDPENRLLARGPRFRMSAEMVRDQALAVAGLLSPKMYGAPVRPPQPKLGVSAAFGSAVDWQTSAGDDRYRRALYTTWRRSNPYPSMATFDAPNREVCTLRRNRTNTPLQALVTLNDPVFLEAAQALARRLVAQSTDPHERVEYAFRLCLARSPTPAEDARLLALVGEARARLSTDPARATALATVPLGPAPAGTEVAELAAWTVLANVMLNLDEFLMRR